MCGAHGWSLKNMCTISQLACCIQIESEVDCDTFFPEMSQDKWRLWSSSAPRQDKDMRYSFQCYVPASATSSSTAPALPPAIAAQHEELQVFMTLLPYLAMKHTLQCGCG